MENAKCLHRGYRIFFVCKNAHTGFAKKTDVLYTGKVKMIPSMKKYQDSTSPIAVDPITNEYKITVPEWIVNEFDWYEDTELVWVVNNEGIHIQETE